MGKAKEAIKIGKSKKRMKIMLYLLIFGGLGTAITLQFTGPYKGYMDPTMDKIFQSSEEFIAEVNREDEPEEDADETGEDGETGEGDKAEGDKTEGDETEGDKAEGDETAGDKPKETKADDLKFKNTGSTKKTNVNFGPDSKQKKTEFFDIEIGPQSNRLTAYDINDKRGKSPKSLKTEVTGFANWINFQQKRMGGTLVEQMWARPYDDAKVMYMVMSSQYSAQSRDFKKRVVEMLHRQWIERIQSRSQAHVVIINKQNQIVGGSKVSNGSSIWVK